MFCVFVSLFFFPFPFNFPSQYDTVCVFILYSRMIVCVWAPLPNISACTPCLALHIDVLPFPSRLLQTHEVASGEDIDECKFTCSVKLYVSDDFHSDRVPKKTVAYRVEWRVIHNVERDSCNLTYTSCSHTTQALSHANLYFPQTRLFIFR